MAAASERMIVIADETKWVQALGRFPLPIEVIPFGLAATRTRHREGICESGVSGQMVVQKAARTAMLSSPMAATGFSMPTSGKYPMHPHLAGLLNPIPGVVEHGLFIGLAAWRCWRAHREFALLNGANAATGELG